jgi:hypothetical protein
MHQLTKDPEWVVTPGEAVPAARARHDRFELSRYLDYCSEMLSITGKIAALYIQDFDDDVALAAVNEVENLTTGLSRKIWQKLMIVFAMGRRKDRMKRPGRTPRRLDDGLASLEHPSSSSASESSCSPSVCTWACKGSAAATGRPPRASITASEVQPNSA